MQLIRFFIYIIFETASSPLLYPLWWLFFSWLIWSLLKRRHWPRPSVSIMLIYSTSTGIFFLRNLQGYVNCIELCVPYFSLFSFIVEVSFWSVVLYIPISLAIKPGKLLEQKKNWCIIFLVALGVGLILSEESVYEFRSLPFAIRDLTYFDLISKDIYFYPVMGMLVPWFIWLLLGIFERSRPNLSIMLIYSLSLASITTRLWVRDEMCKMGNLCVVNFSLPLFVGEFALWFVPLYALMKLISRIEIRRLDHAIVAGNG
jgi:hypothetical protein